MSPITKKGLLTTILVVLIVINLGALAGFFFWPGHRYNNHPKDCENKCNPREFLKKELGLSEAQGQQMDALRESHRDTLSFWADKMQQKRNQLSLEMMKETPDTAALFASCDEIGAIYSTIRKLNIYHYWEMKKICNVEQKKKLDTVFKHMFCCGDGMFDKFKKFQKHGCMKDGEGPDGQGCMKDGEGPDGQGCMKDGEGPGGHGCMKDKDPEHKECNHNQ
jgi:Spy/CpxP family protein refolding chaperone